MIRTKNEKDFFVKWLSIALKTSETSGGFGNYECDDGEIWSFFERRIGKGRIVYRREEDAYNASRAPSDINGYRPFVLISKFGYVYCYDNSLCGKNGMGVVDLYSFNNEYDETNRGLWKYDIPEIYKELNIELDESKKEFCEIHSRKCARAIQLGIKDEYDVITDQFLFSPEDYENVLLGIIDAKSAIKEKIENISGWSFEIELFIKVKELLSGPELVTEYEKELAEIFHSHELVDVYLSVDNGKEELVQPDISSFFLNELSAEEPLLWSLDEEKKFGFESISRIIDKITEECVYDARQKENEDGREER